MTLAVGLSPIIRSESLPETTWDGLERYLSKPRTTLCLLDGYVDVPLLTERYLARQDKSVSKTDIFTEHLLRFSHRGKHAICPTIQLLDSNGNVISEKQASRRLIRTTLLRAMFDVTKFLLTVDIQ